MPVFQWSFIGLPDLLLAGRIFTCAGILFFLVGRIIGMMSLTILKTETPESSKAKMTVAAGFVNIVAGLFLGKLTIHICIIIIPGPKNCERK